MFFSPNWPCFGILTSPLWPFWKKRITCQENSSCHSISMSWNKTSLKTTKQTIPATSPPKKTCHEFILSFFNGLSKILPKKNSTHSPHSSAGNSLGMCVRCGGRSSRVSGSSAARTAAGTSDFKLSKPVKGMAPGAMAPVALDPLDGLEGRLTWQGFTGCFFGGWWVFFFGWMVTTWGWNHGIRWWSFHGWFGFGFLWVQSVLILVLLNIQTHRSEICQCV